jgi:hypothetical protein
MPGILQENQDTSIVEIRLFKTVVANEFGEIPMSQT